MALMLGACASEPFAVQGPAPMFSMAGRWTLAAPNAPSCRMTFEEAAAGQSNQGSIQPDGGCPGNFFMSRSWVFAQGKLTISDYHGRPLADLPLADNGFQGQSTAGTPVKLTR